MIYSKTCVKWPLSKRPKIGFHDQLSLYAGQKYCRILQGEHSAILTTSLSYHLSLRSLFCLFFSGSFTQVLLYSPKFMKSMALFVCCHHSTVNMRVYGFMHISSRAKPYIRVINGSAVIQCRGLERVYLMYQIHALTAWILYNNSFDYIKTFYNYYIRAHTAVYVRIFSGTYFLRDTPPVMSV